MVHYRRNLILFGITLLVVGVTYFVRTTEAEQSVKIIGDDIGAITQEYHERLNKMFNERIEKMVKAMGKEKDPQKLIALFSPPEMKVENGIPTVRGPCIGEGANQNLSTYCLALDATEAYFQFREGMSAARAQLATRAATQFEKVGQKIGEKPETVFEQRNLFGALGDVFQAERSIQSYGASLERIDREIEIARQTLDQALAAYNEMQLAFPLHRKYLEIIKSLEIYRNKISAIRREIEKYPPTFFDVTTTACT